MRPIIHAIRGRSNTSPSEHHDAHSLGESDATRSRSSSVGSGNSNRSSSTFATRSSAATDYCRDNCSHSATMNDRGVLCIDAPDEYFRAASESATAERENRDDNELCCVPDSPHCTMLSDLLPHPVCAVDGVQLDEVEEERVLLELEALRLRALPLSSSFTRHILPVLAWYTLRDKFGDAVADHYTAMLRASTSHTGGSESMQQHNNSYAHACMRNGSSKDDDIVVDDDLSRCVTSSLRSIDKQLDDNHESAHSSHGQRPDRNNYCSSDSSTARAAICHVSPFLSRINAIRRRRRALRASCMQQRQQQHFQSHLYTLRAPKLRNNNLVYDKDANGTKYSAISSRHICEIGHIDRNERHTRTRGSNNVRATSSVFLSGASADAAQHTDRNQTHGVTSPARRAQPHFSVLEDELLLSSCEEQPCDQPDTMVRRRAVDGFSSHSSCFIASYQTMMDQVLGKHGASTTSPYRNSDKSKNDDTACMSKPAYMCQLSSTACATSHHDHVLTVSHVEDTIEALGELARGNCDSLSRYTAPRQLADDMRDCLEECSIEQVQAWTSITAAGKKDAFAEETRSERDVACGEKKQTHRDINVRGRENSRIDDTTAGCTQRSSSSCTGRMVAMSSSPAQVDNVFTITLKLPTRVHRDSPGAQSSRGGDWRSHAAAAASASESITPTETSLRSLNTTQLQAMWSPRTESDGVSSAQARCRLCPVHHTSALQDIDGMDRVPERGLATQPAGDDTRQQPKTTQNTSPIHRTRPGNSASGSTVRAERRDVDEQRSGRLQHRADPVTHTTKTTCSSAVRVAPLDAKYNTALAHMRRACAEEASAAAVILTASTPVKPPPAHAERYVRMRDSEPSLQPDDDPQQQSRKSHTGLMERRECGNASDAIPPCATGSAVRSISLDGFAKRPSPTPSPHTRCDVGRASQVPTSNGKHTDKQGPQTATHTTANDAVVDTMVCATDNVPNEMNSSNRNRPRKDVRPTSKHRRVRDWLVTHSATPSALHSPLSLMRESTEASSMTPVMSNSATRIYACGDTTRNTCLGHSDHTCDHSGRRCTNDRVVQDKNNRTTHSTIYRSEKRDDKRGSDKSTSVVHGRKHISNSDSIDTLWQVNEAIRMPKLCQGRHSSSSPASKPLLSAHIQFSSHVHPAPTLRGRHLHEERSHKTHCGSSVGNSSLMGPALYRSCGEDRNICVNDSSRVLAPSGRGRLDGNEAKRDNDGNIETDCDEDDDDEKTTKHALSNVLVSSSSHVSERARSYGSVRDDAGNVTLSKVNLAAPRISCTDIHLSAQVSTEHRQRHANGSEVREKQAGTHLAAPSHHGERGRARTSHEGTPRGRLALVASKGNACDAPTSVSAGRDATERLAYAHAAEEKEQSSCHDTMIYGDDLSSDAQRDLE